MKMPKSVRSAEALGRVRLSQSFFMRDFLHSEIAALNGSEFAGGNNNGGNNNNCS